MSFVVRIVIFCDGARDCPNTFTRAVANEGGLTKTRIANAAAEEGWQVRRGLSSSADPTVAYCPTHRKAGVAS